MSEIEKFLEILFSAPSSPISASKAMAVRDWWYKAKIQYADKVNTCGVDEWISVDAYLPDADFEVLVASGDDVMTSIFRTGYVHGDYWFDCEVGEKWSVTHWMPLPQPPKVTK